MPTVCSLKRFFFVLSVLMASLSTDLQSQEGLESRFVVDLEKSDNEWKVFLSNALKQANSFARDHKTDFFVEALIDFKAHKRATIIDEVRFSADKPRGAGGDLTLGSEFYFLNQQSGRDSLVFPLGVKSKNSNSDLKNRHFDEFNIQFSGIPGFPVCEPDFKLTSKIPAFREKGSKELHNFSFHKREEYSKDFAIDFENQARMRKDLGYQLRRLINLEPHDAWFFSQEEQIVVFQKRVDKGITDPGYIDILLRKRVTIDHVNILIRDDATNSGDRLIHFYEIPQPESIDSHLMRVRLDLRKAVGDAFGEGKSTKFRVKELFLHVSTTGNLAWKDDLGVVGINFLKVRNSSGDSNVEKLSGRVETIDGDAFRLIAELPVLQSIESLEVRFNALKGSPCAVRFDYASLISIGQEMMPIYADADRAFLSDASQGHRKLRKTGLVSAAEIIFELPMGIRINAASDASPIIKNLGQRLKIDSDTYLYFSAEHDGFADVNLLTGVDRLSLGQIPLNKAVRISEDNRTITGIELTFSRSSVHPENRIGTLYFMRENLTTTVDSLSSPMPNFSRVYPIASQADQHSAQHVFGPGFAKGVLTQESNYVEFSVPIDKPLQSTSNLDLDYEFKPGEMQNKCFLSLRFNFEHAVFEQPFCSESFAGHLSIPIQEFIDSKKIDKTLGNLLSIDWMVVNPNKKSNNFTVYDMKFSYFSWGVNTVGDMLLEVPLILADAKPIHLSEASLAEVIKSGLVKDVWVRLDENAFRFMSKAGRNLGFPNNQFLRIKKLAIEPTEFIDWYVSGGNAPDVKSEYSIHFLIILASILILIFYLGKRRYWINWRVTYFAKVTKWRERLASLGRPSFRRYLISLRAIALLVLLVISYYLGNFSNLGHSYYLSWFGDVVGVFLSIEIIQLTARWLARRNNFALATFISRRSRVYFVTAVLMAFAMFVLLATDIILIAERFGVIMFYALVMGCLLELKALRRSTKQFYS